MEWLITNALAAWLIPPGIVLVVLFAAWLLAWRRPPLARALVLLAAVALYALSTPFVGEELTRLLEPARADPLADRTGQAIVVLGGGVYHLAPEYGADTVRAQTLARLRYAARLQRALRKPVLVSGGAPEGNPVPEARLMKETLERDFQVPVRWTEDLSRNTLQNARLSRLILGEAGVERVYLVTHAWHMRRARLAFESAGFTVIAAPTAFTTRLRLGPLDFLPSAEALFASSRFFREAIGLGWYHLRIVVGG